MPRKANYGIDYDTGYDTYDDYDYDYDYDIGGDETGKQPSQVKKEVDKSGLWRCSICTYDNHESLSFCDICGVVRDSSLDFTNDGEEKVDGTCKNSGASIMARSLFAPMPTRAPKSAVTFQQLNNDLCNEANNSHQNRNFQARIDDLQKTHMVPHRNHLINIVPFKFDSPSPDDLVSAGKKSSKVILKAPAKTSSSIGKKKGVEGSSVCSTASGLGVSESSNAADNQDKTQIPSSKLQNLKLDKPLGYQKNSPSTSISNSHTQYKPEKWMLKDQDQGILIQLNLAIVGHVDSGKSTLSGRLLHLLGRISQKKMHKYEKDAKEKGKGSFAYAWAMDERAEERERGITMAVAVAYFDSRKYHVVLHDSPGHKDFIPNMISGTTQADAAILVVDSSLGAFEAGLDGNGGGQTREHSQLIRSFGVEHIIVAINKMDVVEYSKDRFEYIKLQLGSFLRVCGFKESCVSWIPLSAIGNQNLVTAASDVRLSSWYQGPCLLDAVDSIPPPVRDISKPLRLPICDIIGTQSLGHVAASGKLESGAIRNGSKVLVMPSGDLATVRSIEHDARACNVARAGDNVAVSLQGIDGNQVMSGGVLCHPDFPVVVATCLELKVLVLDITIPILIGTQVEFHIHHAKEAARVAKIVSVIDQKTGKVSKRAPRFLTSKQSAVIEVVLEGAVCVEEFSTCRALGRAFLRASGSTIAVGIVTRIVEQ